MLSFLNFLWFYVDYKVVVYDIKVFKDILIEIDIFKFISRDLKRLGFKFVGSIIIYVFL